ncbi:MAG: class C sortase [Defluviitaleaceae bacterium]|nr:class C sortase [Defluviitaleaceae bacterium]
MERDKVTCIFVLIIIVVYLVYPHIQHRRFDTRAQYTISQFEARVEAYRAAHHNRQLAHDEGSHPFWLENISHWLSAINNQIYNGPTHLLDPFVYRHPPFNLRHMGFDTDIIGALTIPKIDLNLPIYLGAYPQHLNNGVAHLMHSSFPVGGENTNAVIAGERNLHHGRVFRDIQLLEVGDEITITNFMETIVYKVIETKVIQPYQVDELAVQSGRDLVTLLTPHTRRRGDQRYIVIAERI